MKNKSAIEKGIRNSKLKKKLGEQCVYCKCTNPLILTIDHIKPLIRNGEDKDSNKQVACVVCNWLKGGLNHEEYLKYFEALKTMKDLNKIKLEINELKLLFSPFGIPKLLKDLEEKK